MRSLDLVLLVAGIVATGLLVWGAIAWLRFDNRKRMEGARDVARVAGLLPVEAWEWSHSGFTGEATLLSWRLRYDVRAGRGGSLRLTLRLPRELTFSPLLSRGPVRLAGWGMPHVKGGLAIARGGWCDPPEARVLLTASVQARLEAHPAWARAGRVALSADQVEYWGDMRLVEDAAHLREVVDVLVIVAEQGLTLRSLP